MSLFKIGDSIIYKRDLCIVKDIKKNHIMGKDYYILSPIEDKSLTIDIPTDNKYVRNIISPEKANEIINSIHNINIIDVDGKLLEYEYRNLINGNNYEELIKIIKTSYLRNKKRKDCGRKSSDKDLMYFQRAEKYLYNELAVALSMSYDDCKKYVIDMVLKQEKNSDK